MTHFWDRVGISTSILCVIHCLLTPVLLVSLPFIGQTFASEWVHIFIGTIAIPVAAFALWSGYQSHHQSRVLWLGSAGSFILIAALVLGHDHDQVEIALMVSAGLLLASAHYLNLKHCHCPKHH